MESKAHQMIWFKVANIVFIFGIISKL